MQRLLLTTVSIVALTAVTRAAGPPNVGEPLSLIPVADWIRNDAIIQGGSAHKDSLSKESIGPANYIIRKHGTKAFLINDAISQAVLTNPGVGEASANRRATETERNRS
jgi:hypothetical protein